MNTQLSLTELEQRWVNAATVMVQRIGAKRTPDAVKFLGSLMAEIERNPPLGSALFAELVLNERSELAASLVSIMSPKVICSTFGALSLESIAQVCASLSPVQLEQVMDAIPVREAQGVERLLLKRKKRESLDELVAQIEPLDVPHCWDAVDVLGVAQRLSVLDRLGKDFARAYFLQKQRKIDVAASELPAQGKVEDVSDEWLEEREIEDVSGESLVEKSEPEGVSTEWPAQSKVDYVSDQWLEQSNVDYLSDDWSAQRVVDYVPDQWLEQSEIEDLPDELPAAPSKVDNVSYELLDQQETADLCDELIYYPFD